MAYRTTLIQKLTPVFIEDRKHLSLLLNGIGNALCWVEDLWPALQEAYDAGTEITLDIFETREKGMGDKPILHIEGIEHPGQEVMFDEAPDDSFEEDEDVG